MVERCLRGEPAAFREVVDRYGRGVEGTLVRILGPRRDIEDLMQQVFLELSRALPRFRGHSSFATFLMGIAANVARRTIERRPQAPLEFDLDTLPGTDDPESKASARQMLERTFMALARISSRKRIAFILHVVECKEIREVAAIVGAKEATVRARVEAARSELEAMVGRMLR